MKYSISLAQMHIQFGNIDANEKRAVEMIDQAAATGSSLVVLPELWSSGYDLKNGKQHASATPAILANLSALAHTHQIHIAGSLLDQTAEGLRNTLFWQSPNQDAPARYSKIHLFGLMQEPSWLLPGDRLQQVQAPWGETGLAVCYDLRFPELFRSYTLSGAVAFTICAEWPARRSAHWEILLRARAIENQAFIFASNCVGNCADETFGGKSVLISPWGHILVEGSPQEEALVSAEIDTDLIEEARKFLPVIRDRRPDLYSL